jgi:hypothetical protein
MAASFEYAINSNLAATDPDPRFVLQNAVDDGIDKDELMMTMMMADCCGQ